MTQSPALYLRGTAHIGGAPIFSNLDLHVPATGWTCLLGASGVGKSTVLRLFAGLSDHVEFLGEIGTTDGPLAGQVTLMAQDDLLLPWLSILENAMLGARLRGQPRYRERAIQVLDQVGLSAHLSKKPHELSGGQRQRAALARTLMEDRPIVLLDEPFSALDAMTRAQMQDLTADLLGNRTVLLVTHDPAEAARLGQKIIIMEPDGMASIAPPKGSIPRAVDDAGVLQTQAHLLKGLTQ